MVALRLWFAHLVTIKLSVTHAMTSFTATRLGPLTSGIKYITPNRVCQIITGFKAGTHHGTTAKASYVAVCVNLFFVCL